MYHLIQTTNETIAFIEKYLSEDEPVIPSKRDSAVIKRRWNEINDDFSQPNINKNDIAYYIRHYYPAYNTAKYNLFLRTYYWVIIADMVKYRAHFLCVLNYEHDATFLDAHHGGYDIHGRELQNIDLIISLCHDCHQRYHLDAPIRTEVSSVAVERREIMLPKEIIKEVVKIEKVYIPLQPVEKSFESALVTERYIGYQLAVLQHALAETKFKSKFQFKF